MAFGKGPLCAAVEAQTTALLQSRNFSALSQHQASGQGGRCELPAVATIPATCCHDSTP
ncbi:rCG62053 [Rattus norvegicus]|uniref:RCG62053 n=1 Tax=Rattus norvegicus TaxID=10116 RepID=A6HAQ6_RAT|nr:rCG62053 [Rattus norvegicus]